MITDQLIGTIHTIINFIIGLFPDYSSLPSNVASSITTVFSGINFVNAFLDVSTVFTIFALMLTIEGSILTLRMVNKIYNMIRGSGG
jgi:hypothetical protein